MQAHRKEGLCYNCDDKFTRGHQCTKHKPYFLDVASPLALEICDTAQDLVDDQVDIPQPPIDPQIAKQVDCFVHPFSNFKVMVSNGSTLPCKGKCHNVCISIGDYNLRSNMFSMPLGGCDVILGTQRLRTLGPILWDFAELWVHFSVNGKKHTLKGLQPGSLSIISSHRMENILMNNSHGVIAQLHFIQMQPSAVSTIGSTKKFGYIFMCLC